MDGPNARRRLIVAAAIVVGVAPAARAQSAPRIRRIGFVSPTTRGPRDEAFRQGLAALGYVEGRDVVVEMRFADGQPERLPALVMELNELPVDVLVVGATVGARAAKQAGLRIPVVFAGSSDPVAGGIVANLARPEGNITGISLAVGDGFAAKWIELLKEAVPGLAHCAALWSSSNAAAARFVEELQGAARKLRLRLDAHHAADVPEFDRATAAIARSGAQGLVVTPSPFAATQRRRIVEFAAARRLPAIYFDEEFPDAGGLMSYGPSIVDAYRQAARYVDKLIKGAAPADLPVEQPTRFDLVINLEAARALELRVPQSLLVRADRVIGAASR